MAKEINILHISDLHATQRSETLLRNRCDALVADLSFLTSSTIDHLDAVLFTGDLAYYGRKEEYSLAEAALLRPLMKKFQLSEKKVFIVPGNHDIDRTASGYTEENNIQENNIRKGLTDTKKAEREFYLHTHKPKQKAFDEFYNSFYGESRSLANSKVLSVNGVDIGIGCIDSAWRCFDDKDKNKLFITERQVNTVASNLDECACRIALLHHPFDWLHSDEELAINDLQRRFELILTGHLHTARSLAEQTTSHSSIAFTTPALFDGVHGDGFNLYTINLENRTLKARFRKYVRGRNEFDRDTVHARDGEHEFTLPAKNLSRISRALVLQRIGSGKGELQLRIKERLQLLQKTENPVLVSPRILTIFWRDSAKVQAPFLEPTINIASSNACVFGPSEAGKTIFLESLGADLNEFYQNSKQARFALYVDLGNEDGPPPAEQVSSELARHFGNSGFDGDLVLLLDHLTARSFERFRQFVAFAKQKSWKFVCATGNELLLETIAKAEEFSVLSLKYYEITYWGPSRIREFTRQYFSDGTVNIDAAFSFVSSSMRDTDLPSTPYIVTLYLSVFPSLGNLVTSLSFVSLLEKIENARLGGNQTSASESLYNKREVLMRFAVELFQSRGNVIARAKCCEIIQGFFKSKLLDVDASAVLASLIESSLLSIEGDEVRFSYFSFFDYFLARAFEKHLLDPRVCLKTIQDCITVSQALSLYGGLVRENVAIAKYIMELVSGIVPGLTDFTTADLQKYIKHLIAPDAKDGSSDKEAEHVIASRQSDESADREFEADKKKNEESRRKGISVGNPTSQIEKIALLSQALRTFYNLFRNLENIDGEDKLFLLDRILDFHIHCNLEYIKFFHSLSKSESASSFLAYLVTIGGQLFLSENIGNENLRPVFEKMMAETKNDFKELLLVNVFSDLRLPGYQSKIEKYANKTNSVAAVEILYLQVRRLMVTHVSLNVPASLVSLFHSVYKRREALSGFAQSSKASKSNYDDVLKGIQRDHLVFFNAKEAILNTRDAVQV
jgi:3',5'-cyclic AMP phosphodiesterase CpdA